MTRRYLMVVYISNQTFHWFIIGLLVPVMALLQLARGFTLFQIGMVTAVYGGTVMLFELPTGGLADAVGRKRLYLISLVMLMIAAAIVLIAGNLPVMMAGFFFWGVARALSSGSMDAWFVDEFYRIAPDGNLQQALAVVGVFIPIGIGCGALAGGLLPMTLGAYTSQIRGFSIYSANILTIMACLFLQFILTALLVREYVPPKHQADLWSGFKRFPQVVSTSMTYGLKNRTIFLLLLSSLAWGIGMMGLEVLWQPQVKQILGSDSQTWIFGVLSTGYFLASSLGSLLATPLCTLFHNNYARVLFIIRIVMGALYAGLASQTGLVGFTTFYWTLFMGNGMLNSPYLAVFNSQIPERQRSTLLSFQSLFEQFGGLIGSLLLGYLANILSISAAWVVAAEILVLSSLAYAWLPNQSRQPLPPTS